MLKLFKLVLVFLFIQNLSASTQSFDFDFIKKDENDYINDFNNRLDGNNEFKVYTSNLKSIEVRGQKKLYVFRFIDVLI